MDLVKVLSEQQLKSDLPELKIGDTVKVHAKIKEGNRERIQVFEGIIIAKKHAGVNQTVTVRRISYGVGVEKTFPVHSPNVAKFEVVRNGKVRRAKLYYLRGRVGKAAKIAEKISSKSQTKTGSASSPFLHSGSATPEEFSFFPCARGRITL